MVVFAALRVIPQLQVWVGRRLRREGSAHGGIPRCGRRLGSRHLYAVAHGVRIHIPRTVHAEQQRVVLLGNLFARAGIARGIGNDGERGRIGDGRRLAGDGPAVELKGGIRPEQLLPRGFHRSAPGGQGILDHLLPAFVLPHLHVGVEHLLRGLIVGVERRGGNAAGGHFRADAQYGRCVGVGLRAAVARQDNRCGYAGRRRGIEPHERRPAACGLTGRLLGGSLRRGRNGAVAIVREVALIGGEIHHGNQCDDHQHQQHAAHERAPARGKAVQRPHGDERQQRYGDKNPKKSLDKHAQQPAKRRDDKKHRQNDRIAHRPAGALGRRPLRRTRVSLPCRARRRRVSAR